MDTATTDDNLLPIISKSASSSSSTSSSGYDKQLRLATEKNPVILMELAQDGAIRYISDTWETLIGPRHRTHIADLIVGSEDDKQVFHRAIEMMLMNDDLSYTVTFNVLRTKDESISSAEVSGVHSNCSNEIISATEGDSDDSRIITLEACGILIRDNETHLALHSMWIVKPYSLREFEEEVNSILPPDFIKRLGFGATLFAEYLKEIENEQIVDQDDLPNPKMVLCRVCETIVPAWWLETHSEHCVCEHRLDSLIHLLHDNLVEALMLLKNDAIQEYKQLPINVRSASTQMVLQSLKELCDIAINVNISEIRLPGSTQAATEDILMNPITLTQGYQRAIYDFSPNTKWNIENVQNWQVNMKEELESNVGLSLLAHDTIDLAKKKIDAVLRLDNAMTYSLKIKNEVNNWVLQLILIQIEKNRNNLRDNANAPDNICSLKGIVLSDQANEPPAQENETFNSNELHSLEVHASLSKADVEREGPNDYVRFQQPQLHHVQEEIFANSYMQNDSMPEKRKEGPDIEVQRSGRVSSDQNSSYSSFSSTRFESKSLSRSLTPRQRLDDQQSILQAIGNESSNKKDLSTIDVTAIVDRTATSPSLPSIISTKPNSFTNSSLLPKYKSTVSLTQGRSSPLPSMDAVHLSREDSSSRRSDDKSPVLLNSGLPKNYLTPEQYPSSSSLPKQPLSPLLLATNQSKSTVSSIKDYDILKPISKGAYGSVYLARKKLTGDYFAIKILKKSDMIAKNQITNVKSERAIMMVQSDKPYVARLYASFQNKDNLFLVMEYLPGGDLSMLIKMMGFLPEKWAKQYISEVIVGVDDMHQNSIIHHDLKPDNLLIDLNGHVKLTDFGLSRAGLVRRHQNLSRPRKASLSLDSGDHSSVGSNDVKPQVTYVDHRTRSNSSSSSIIRPSSCNRKGSIKHADIEQLQAGQLAHSAQSSHSMALGDITLKEKYRNDSLTSSNSNTDISALQRSDSQVSFSLLNISRPSTPTLPILNTMHVRNTSNASDILSDTPVDLALFHPEDSRQDKSFFGTPDYLAPETIEGTGEDDRCDWWSVGCILFELLYGYPPFHASSPEDVFKKILAREIQWPSYSNPEEQEAFENSLAKDLLSKLLVIDPSERLGSNGAQEIKDHPYFADVDWNRVYDEEASFVPSIEHPEDTDYFDLRGAVLEDFDDTEGELGDTTVPGFTPLLNAGGSDRRHSASFSASHGEYSPNTPLNKLCVSSVLESVSKENSNRSSPTLKHFPLAIPPHMRDRRVSKLNDSQTEFGSFYFRNLSALDKANKDAINRLKSEHLTDSPGGHRRSSSASHVSSSSDSSGARTRAGRVSASGSPGGVGHGPSKSFSVFDSPSLKVSSPDMSFGTDSNISARKGSGGNNHSSASSGILHFNDDFSTASKLRSPLSPTYGNSPHMTPSHTARSRLITNSSQPRRGSNDVSMEEHERLSAISRVNSLRFRRRSGRRSSGSSEVGYHMDVLVCEPIAIHRYRVSKDLESLGCSVVSVGAGDELISRATSGVKFDLIFTALKIPKLGAVDIVRLLKHTNSVNSATPVVAITNYYQEAINDDVFDEVLEKPVAYDQLRKSVAKYALQKAQQQEDTIISDSDFESNS
ncbi:hypothetical protein HG535_0D05830 [Zygotorulaspora mrakii]|uniref:non-specific serine/threonine protein kinase n=1 Tax=Zygotorulaspora mrakii TaxID=42260 RepID=A0A7H9B3A0_ZYGMR|nr:uncharacterized protein HG535_0D05830 [Zygotorulaspora mrakii]QLG72874.1 hypothetical protein HG535_0D05830 [Zygotorulaspora mrakii]